MPPRCHSIQSASLKQRSLTIQRYFPYFCQRFSYAATSSSAPAFPRAQCITSEHDSGFPSTSLNCVCVQEPYETPDASVPSWLRTVGCTTHAKHDLPYLPAHVSRDFPLLTSFPLVPFAALLECQFVANEHSYLHQPEHRAPCHDKEHAAGWDKKWA